MMLLRARLVIPISGPPIEDGAVLVSDGRIKRVGRSRDLVSLAGEGGTDLGEVVLMPGLVNAHCHLDYTDLAGQFPPPRVFSDWLKQITTAKAQWEYSDYAQSWLKGARMLVRTGTTTVGDIEAVPALLPEVWNSTPLRVVSMLELIGITGRREPAAILQESLGRIKSLKHSRCRVGLSPHAPYSTLPELLRLCARAAQRGRFPISTHIAESALEYEMFVRGRGAMFDWLKPTRSDMSDCGSGTPVQHVARSGLLGENLLAIHVNYLGRGDAQLLAQKKVTVVHCPRSHAYFRHKPFPLRTLLAAGVNVCLGSDSLASVVQARRRRVELNMFEEMRALARSSPSLAAKRIVEMATVNSARALGMKGKVGELRAGAFADLIALPTLGRTRDVYEQVVHYSGNVLASMIDGQWVLSSSTWSPSFSSSSARRSEVPREGRASKSEVRRRRRARRI
jgi:cytosine/adenosine deaminase-related metal-dependent hydrolase